MNERIINIEHYTDITSLKKFILQNLNLVDQKKDSAKDFLARLKMYIDRNQNLKIILQVDRVKLEKDLKFNLSLTRFPSQPYPENFEMGNPHNRWIQEPITRSEE